MNIAELHEGMKVRSADGTSLGKIVQLAGDTLIIEKGFFFPKDYACDVKDVADVRDDEVWLSVRDDALQAGDTLRTGDVSRTTTGTAAREEVRVPLHEEELTAEKRTREAGEVRVRKEVVTEHRTVDVPVTREEVHVERVPASA
ncbi:MAG TPA: YsnF/AvaK domain-containing protein, partial [Anaeromyxobacteraceae bacterium]|nr:YsnF/AvaK domain-containing protein [Anaeromyxobacteraceae bacterium]